MNAFENINLSSVKITLTEDQNNVVSEIIRLLGKEKRAILKAYCGFGKTLVSLFVAIKLGYKTLIILPQEYINTLSSQWVETVKSISPYISIKTYQQGSFTCLCDIFITTPEYTRRISFPFNKFGLAIIDEVHCLLTDNKQFIFNRIQNLYVLGLSATPEGARSDTTGKKDKLCDFFGATDTFIKRFITRNKNTTVIYYTNICPKIRHRYIGRKKCLDWQYVCESIDLNEAKNKFIVNKFSHYSDRKTLFLSKRCKQVDILFHLLKKEYKDSKNITRYTGKYNIFYSESDIIIATVQKAGIGFNWPEVECVVLATDIRDLFIQKIGRLFRVLDKPSTVIVDFCDKYSIFKKHLNTRKRVYKKIDSRIFVHEN